MGAIRGRPRPTRTARSPSSASGHRVARGRIDRGCIHHAVAATPSVRLQSPPTGRPLRLAAHRRRVRHLGLSLGQFGCECGAARLAPCRGPVRDPQQGWVVGAGRILATEDAGKNWQVQYQGSAKLFGVDFVDVDHGFAIGTNQVLGTDNGGRQWSEVKEPCLAISSVYFTSPNVGYAVAGEFCNMVRPSRYAVANYSSPSTEVTSGASTTRHRHLSRARVSHRGLMAGLARQAKSGVRQTVDFAGRSPSPNRDVRGLLLNRATPRWCSVAGRVVPGSCFPAPVPPPGIPPMLPLPQRTGSSGVLCSRKDSPSPRSCP